MSGDLDVLSWLDEEESVLPAVEVRSTNTLTSQDFSGTCFEINREVLLALLEKAFPVVPSRDMVPVLTNFQFQVEPGKLTVVASSLENSIVLTTDQVDVKVPGVEVFPAKTLLTIIKEAHAGSNVYIEVTPVGAVVVSGGFSAEIKLNPGKDFPKMGSLDAVSFHQIERAAFLEAISAVKYALPGKDFSGQASLRMISIKGGKFTACDGSRFQQVRIPGFKLNMQLPSMDIALLIRFLSGSDAEYIEVGELEKKLVFKLGSSVFYINKIVDPYPNVEQLWLRPALSNDQELIVNRKELITAIKQVRFAVDSAYSAIGMIIESDKLTVTAKGSDSSASDVIGCKWAGKPRTVVVNCYHLAEMIKAYTQEECKFLLGEDSKQRKSPILLKDDETMAIATISQLLAYRAGL